MDITGALLRRYIFMGIYLRYGQSKGFPHNYGTDKMHMVEQSTRCPHLRHSELKRRREAKSWRNFRKLLHWEVQYGSYPDKRIHKKHWEKNTCKSLDPKEDSQSWLTFTYDWVTGEKKNAINPSMVTLQSRGEAQFWVQSVHQLCGLLGWSTRNRLGTDAALKRHTRLRGVLAPVLELVSIKQRQTSRHPIWVCLCCSLGLGPALPGSYAHAGQWGELRNSGTSTPSWFSL